MKTMLVKVMLTGMVSGMLVFAPVAMAEEHGGGMQGMHGMHGMGKMHGKGHGGGHHDDNWHDSLTEEQQKQVDKLHLGYLQKVTPIKSKIKAAKIELALLITADKPNQKEIDKKIDEITKLQAEKMRHKAAHKIDVRKLLNEEQRVKFDLHVLNKASKTHRGGGHH